MNTVRGIVHAGKNEFLEPIEVSEGTEVLIAVPSADENEFWLKASEQSLDAIWNNSEEDVYEQLLKK
jgi:hypothetical protein